MGDSLSEMVRAALAKATPGLTCPGVYDIVLSWTQTSDSDEGLSGRPNGVELIQMKPRNSGESGASVESFVTPDTRQGDTPSSAPTLRTTTEKSISGGLSGLGREPLPGNNSENCIDIRMVGATGANYRLRIRGSRHQTLVGSIMSSRGREEESIGLRTLSFLAVPVTAQGRTADAALIAHAPDWLASLCDDNDRLLALLREYGRHQEGCSAVFNEPPYALASKPGTHFRCRCGWDEVQKKLEGKA
jgi:hypothetical protein